MGLVSETLKLKTERDNCDALKNFIKKTLSKMDKVLVTEDENGHIFVTKGRDTCYPTFICYLKSFQVLEDFEPRRISHNIWVGVDKSGPVGLTAGVKCGTIILLSLLEKLDVVKCVFYDTDSILSESAIGAKTTFFDNSSLIVEPTYSGRGKIIIGHRGNKYCSEVCHNELTALGEAKGFTPTFSTASVFCRLRESKTTTVSAVGLSAGYFEPYGKYENVVEAELFKSRDFCVEIATKMNRGPYSNVLFNTPSPLQLRACAAPMCYRSVCQGSGHYCPVCLMRLQAQQQKCKSCGTRVLHSDKEIFDNVCDMCFKYTTNQMFG